VPLLSGRAYKASGCVQEEERGKSLWRRSDCLDKQNFACLGNECLLSTGQNTGKTGRCARDMRRTLDRKRQKSQASGCSNTGSLGVLSWDDRVDGTEHGPFDARVDDTFSACVAPSDLHFVDLAVPALLTPK
jgi:hypothetical protein